MSGDHPLCTFVVSSLPEWIIAVFIGIALHRLAGLDSWAAALLVLIWVGADIATFPWRKRYYMSESPVRRIVGEHGVAVSPLSPCGFVRVHGELWQARAGDGATIQKGEALRVRDINGLELVVDPMRPLSAPPQA